MKKIISLLLLAALIVLALVSCSDKIEYQDITYRENGIEIVLPESMRRSTASGYDMYFSTMDIIFTATKIDAELIEENDMNIDPNISAKDYTDHITEDLDKSKLYFSYEEDRELYNFRYTYETDATGDELFYYVIVIGEPGNVWYIEICCDQDDSEAYLADFEVWKKYIKTYKE